MKIIIGTFFAGISTLVAGELYHGPCGGEGVHPWEDKSTESNVSIIRTKGPVKDFVLWENKSSIVYRNDRNELFEYRFTDKSQRYLNRMLAPLSRILDWQERFLLSERVAWILDGASEQPTWSRIGDLQSIHEHLYWRGTKLYSLVPPIDVNEPNPTVNIAVYDGLSTETHQCVLPNTIHGKIHLASGHVFPWLYLYSTQANGDGTFSSVTLYKLRISGGVLGGVCRLIAAGTFENSIYGRVTAVDFFEDGNVAIQTDHPTHQMMWWTGQSCGYVNFDGMEVLVPSHAQARLFTLDFRGTLQMYIPDLTTPIRTNPLNGITLRGIRTRDLWWSSAQERLIVATKIAETNHRMLLSAQLRN